MKLIFLLALALLFHLSESARRESSCSCNVFLVKTKALESGQTQILDYLKVNRKVIFDQVEQTGEILQSDIAAVNDSQSAIMSQIELIQELAFGNITVSIKNQATILDLMAALKGHVAQGLGKVLSNQEDIEDSIQQGVKAIVNEVVHQHAATQEVVLKGDSTILEAIQAVLRELGSLHKNVELLQAKVASCCERPRRKKKNIHPFLH